MNKKFWVLAATFVLLFCATNAPAVRAQAASSEQSGACDSACLKGLVDQYLAALVKHDPTGLPLASNVKFTENTATIELGDGTWVGASEPPTTSRSTPPILFPTRLRFTAS